MNTKSVQPNQLNKAKKALSKLKDYDVETAFPHEIREDEAHLTHLIMVKSAPNMKTMEFEHNTKIVKLHDEALAVAKDNFLKTEQNVEILHDGKKYREENKAAASTAKMEVVKQDAGKDDRIAQLERELEAERNKNKNTSEAHYTNTPKQDAATQDNTQAAGTNTEAGDENKEDLTAATGAGEDAKAASTDKGDAGDVANADKPNASKKNSRGQ